MKSRLDLLLAQKGHAEGRRITLNTVVQETGLIKHTVYGIASNTLKEYPKAALEKLCGYFGCTLDELFELVEEPMEAPAQ